MSTQYEGVNAIVADPILSERQQPQAPALCHRFGNSHSACSTYLQGGIKKSYQIIININIQIACVFIRCKAAADGAQL